MQRESRRGLFERLVSGDVGARALALARWVAGTRPLALSPPARAELTDLWTLTL